MIRNLANRCSCVAQVFVHDLHKVACTKQRKWNAKKKIYIYLHTRSPLLLRDHQIRSQHDLTAKNKDSEYCRCPRLFQPHSVRCRCQVMSSFQRRQRSREQKQMGESHYWTISLSLFMTVQIFHLIINMGQMQSDLDKDAFRKQIHWYRKCKLFVKVNLVD